MRSNPEIYIVVVIGIIVGLLLVGFIVTILFLYQRSRHQQEKEMEQIKINYEQEILRSQLEIQENTFKTIAQELHDNIGQMLSVVKLSLAGMPIEKEHPAYELSQHSQFVLTKAISDLSNLTKSLHTDRISDIGLSEAIQFELHSVKKSGLIDTVFSVLGNEEVFTEQKSIFLFRIFQEALNNSLKHARAGKFSVQLNYENPDIFTMTLSDDGVGFNVDEKINSSASGKGVGLKSVFNRAYLIGAEISMKSEEGNGTVIVVKLSDKDGKLTQKK